jgi:hypothetical protein
MGVDIYSDWCFGVRYDPLILDILDMYISLSAVRSYGQSCNYRPRADSNQVSICPRQNYSIRRQHSDERVVFCRASDKLCILYTKFDKYLPVCKSQYLTEGWAEEAGANRAISGWIRK